MGRSSVAYWPAYFERKPREKKLGFLQSKPWRVVEEDGSIREIQDWSDLKSYLIEFRIDLYVKNFLSREDFPYLLDALQDQKCEIVASASGGLVGVRITGRSRKQAWIGGISVWASLPQDPSSLGRLLALFRHCGVGTQTTPGALGQAIWRDEWKKQELPRVSRPSDGCRADLFDHGTGGRADSFSVGQSFEVAWEQDMTGAYAWAACLVPWGSVKRAIGPYGLQGPDPSSTWFCECTVTITKELLLGPFPIRGGEEVEYPTQEGVYEGVWLWKEESNAAQTAGCIVDVGDGWVWGELSANNESWAHRMDYLRQTAPNIQIANFVKAATVAAIGRHGIRPIKFSLVATAKSRDDQPVSHRNRLTSLYLHPTSEPNTPNLTHWFYYIMTRARLALYQRAMIEIQAGNPVIATNYDALYTLHRSSQPIGTDIGQWKVKRLQHAYFPYSRALVSDEKTRLPGIKRGGKRKTA